VAKPSVFAFYIFPFTSTADPLCNNTNTHEGLVRHYYISIVPLGADDDVDAGGFGPAKRENDSDLGPHLPGSDPRASRRFQFGLGPPGRKRSTQYQITDLLREENTIMFSFFFFFNPIIQPNSKRHPTSPVRGIGPWYVGYLDNVQSLGSSTPETKKKKCGLAEWWRSVAKAGWLCCVVVYSTMDIKKNHSCFCFPSHALTFLSATEE